MINVVRWPELDIITADISKLYEDFYFKTDKGYIMAAFCFPVSQLENLKTLKMAIELKKKELSDTEAYIYKISRDFRAIQ